MLRPNAVLFAIASAMALLMVPVRAAEHPRATPQPPAIPERTFMVTDFGAVGDGTTMNTDAFRATIKACVQAGGGRVVVPEGTFVTGPFELRSAMGLKLAKGANLKMSQHMEDYPVSGRERQAFIAATDAHDVEITGEGTIDGQGEAWWKAFRKIKNTPEEKSEPRRPQMITFARCERVKIEGVKTIDPPNTHCSLRQCTEVTIEGVTMIAPADSPNTDALNLNIRNAVIRNCHIATGDDNIVFLASTPTKEGGPAVENILVSHCTLGVGHGLSFGSFTSGGIRNVTVEDVAFDGTTAGIRLKADRGRGGLAENLTFKKITMKRVKYPVYVTSYYPKTPAHPSDDKTQARGDRTPQWQNIKIEDATITDCPNSIIIWGLPEQSITGVTFRNVIVDAERGAEVYNARDIHFDNVKMRQTKGDPLMTFNAEVAQAPASAFRPGKVHIVLCGDSTVTDNAGWGKGFADQLKETVECINLAKGGRSSNSFIKEGSWRKALDLKPDYVLIQFGHNDQPGHGDRSNDPETTYKQFMTQYVDEARAAGIKPVLVTSLSRREWRDGKIVSRLQPWVDAVKAIAHEKSVPVIDLHALSIERYEQMGLEKVLEISPSKNADPTSKNADTTATSKNSVDGTHLNEKGGALFGTIMAEALKNAVPELAPHIK